MTGYGREARAVAAFFALEMIFSIAFFNLFYEKRNKNSLTDAHQQAY
ncbi:MAG: hypothetical protein LPK21_01110 [Hymenobacteraceae bacterium]|nr:hypothetical protein [Hymenobacteraceae bacterium]MDX5510802.1 hypothetical protein [Hymenobacteraceae bacterium]